MTKSSKTSESFTSLAKIPTYEAGVIQASAFRVTKKITDECLRIYDISTTQWFMIGAIYEAGEAGVSTTDLSRILGTNLPYITNSINVLVHRNIIRRTSPKSDGRLKLLTINPEFIPMIAKIEDSVRTALQTTLYKNIAPQDLLTYIRVLYAFNAMK